MKKVRMLRVIFKSGWIRRCKATKLRLKGDWFIANTPSGNIYIAADEVSSIGFEETKAADKGCENIDTADIKEEISNE